MAAVILWLISSHSHASNNCKAYVRFVNAVSKDDQGGFFAIQDANEMQVFSYEGSRIGSYRAIEPGHIDLRSYSINGTLEVRRQFLAAGAVGYTVILTSMNDHDEFIIMEDPVSASHSGYFSGSYYNLSANTLDVLMYNKLNAGLPIRIPSNGSNQFAPMEFGQYEIQASRINGGKLTHISTQIINEPIVNIFIFNEENAKDAILISTYSKQNVCPAFNSMRE